MKACFSNRAIKVTVVCNILLATVLVAVIGIGLSRHFNRRTSASDGEIRGSDALYVESSFKVEEKPYDIAPGRDYVLYTNFACPYCAALHDKIGSEGYTIRLLLMKTDQPKEEQGAFANQAIVLPYMLKLYREDSERYRQLEDELYREQDSWTDLADDEVLAWLNKRAGRSWAKDDLAGELEELQQAEVCFVKTI